MSLDVRGRVTRTDASGSAVIDTVQADAALAAGFSGSDAGAAWLSRGTTVKYVDPGGQVFSTELTGLQGDTITTIATGGGTVAIGTDQGRVLSWTPGSGEPARSASCRARSSARRPTAARSSPSTTSTGRSCSPPTARPSR